MRATLHLPYPPTTNHLFASFIRGRKIVRARSKEYTAWSATAHNALMLCKPLPVIPGPVTLSFVFGRPDARRRDITNLLKAPEDLLVELGIIEDDSKVHRVIAEWGASSGCTVTIEALA